MKVPVVLALVAAASAQYFSEGWKPGQPITAESAAPTLTGARPQRHIPNPAQPASLSSWFDMNKILTSGPIKGAFEQLGINITERLEAAAVSPWDDRIPMITDDNYADMVINEKLTPEEETERVWVIAVSTAANRQDGLSKFVDNIFDDTYNETLIAGDLPNVRFARIDYLNVTYVTTKWCLWNAPVIVIAQDRGQTLRFYRPNQLRIAGGALRQFIKIKGYEATPPWSSSFAPGGKREFVSEYFAVGMTKMYNLTSVVPRWLMILISGSLASFMINIFHGFGASGQKKPTQHRPQAAATAAAAVAGSTPQTASTSAPASPTPASPSKAKQRKGKGKK